MKTIFLVMLSFVEHFGTGAQAQNSLLPGQRKEDGIQKLLAERYYNLPSCEVSDDAASPSFLFQENINHATTLRALARVQRRVRRHLGVSLVYRYLAFDSTGLTRIFVEAKSKDGTSSVYAYAFNNTDEVGIFEVSYRGLRRWFIGAKSEWPECFHAMLTSR